MLCETWTEKYFGIIYVLISFGGMKYTFYVWSVWPRNQYMDNISASKTFY